MKHSPGIRATSKVKQVSRRQIVITITLPNGGELLTAVLLLVGLGGIVYSLVPLALSPRGNTAAAEQKSAVVQPVEKQETIKRSVPTRLEVPDIALNTELMKSGKNPDGTLAVPERYDIASWYEFSPTPGEKGPAIIVGHVDNYLGPAVFFRLNELQPGQTVRVAREDKSIVEFKVDKVELFDQQNFPTAAVYGNIDYPGLRLITCGGTFNPLTGHYSHNTVVYAKYSASKPSEFPLR